MDPLDIAELRVALPILTLHRYWLWADFHKNVMLEHREHLQARRSDPVQAAAIEFDGLAALTFFYASLFVVIEGWRDLRLSDVEIDELLRSDNTELLRRFRNGVFHFHFTMHSHVGSMTGDSEYSVSVLTILGHG
jgi:hypothetical protein